MNKPTIIIQVNDCRNCPFNEEAKNIKAIKWRTEEIISCRLQEKTEVLSLMFGVCPLRYEDILIKL